MQRKRNTRKKVGERSSRNENFNAKGRKPSRDFKTDSDREYVHRNAKSDNDYAWYNRIPAITGDATKLQYSWPTGRPINIGSQDKPFNWVAPGFQIEYIAPMFGFTSTNDDPLNVSAQQLYAYLRKDQTSSAVFDRPDTMIYLLAIAETFSYIEFLRRAYGLASRASTENTYIPNSLLASMNINPNDLVEHLGDFRYGVNLLIQKVSQFAVPNVMTIFPRKVFMYSGLYTEGTSIKDQLYLYSPAGFYKYSNDSETKAGQLEYVQFAQPGNISSSTLKTVSDLLSYGRTLVNALANAGDVSFVSGAIVKTFGSNLITMNLLPEEYFVQPVFDIRVLEQMCNATVVKSTEYNFPTLSQNPATNSLMFEPEITLTSASQYAAANQRLSIRRQAFTWKKLLQTTTGEVTPEVTMENSRLMLATVLDDPMNNTVLQVYGATEICVGVAWTKAGTGSPATAGWVSNNIWDFALGVYIFENGSNNGIGLDHYPKLLSILSDRSSFKFCPPVWICTTYTTTDYNTVTGNGLATYHHDIGNYVAVDDNDLRRLHEAALISMLDGNLYNVI